MTHLSGHITVLSSSGRLNAHDQLQCRQYELAISFQHRRHEVGVVCAHFRHVPCRCCCSVVESRRNAEVGPRVQVAALGQLTQQAKLQESLCTVCGLSKPREQCLYSGIRVDNTENKRHVGIHNRVDIEQQTFFPIKSTMLKGIGIQSLEYTTDTRQACRCV